MEKYCNKCNTTTSNFTLKGRYCKDCIKIYTRNHYLINIEKNKIRYKNRDKVKKQLYDKIRRSKTEVKLKNTNRRKDSFKILKELIREYKIERGCIDCGYNKHPSALDFDHIYDNKIENVAACKTFASAIEEIKKCEVVCSNCHRIRTINRLHNNKILKENDLNQGAAETLVMYWFKNKIENYFNKINFKIDGKSEESEGISMESFIRSNSQTNRRSSTICNSII